jgi:hypothetical protein
MTAKHVRLILVIAMAISLSGCLGGPNEKSVLFLKTAEELPQEGGDIIYEVFELPESGTLIAFPKEPAENRGAISAEISGQ